jgi:hypothetical protein
MKDTHVSKSLSRIKYFVIVALVIVSTTTLTIPQSQKILAQSGSQNYDHPFQNQYPNRYQNFGATSLSISLQGDISRVTGGLVINVLDERTGYDTTVNTLRDFNPYRDTTVNLENPLQYNTDYMVCISSKLTGESIGCHEYTVLGYGEREIDFDIDSAVIP